MINGYDDTLLVVDRYSDKIEATSRYRPGTYWSLHPHETVFLVLRPEYTRPNGKTQTLKFGTLHFYN